MTTNECLAEIQSRLNNIETRFNNIDTRFNNFDSHLNNIENSLANSQPSEEPTLTDVIKEIKKSRKAVWITPTAFGGSIVLLGISMILTSSNLYGWVFIIIGLAFMSWCLCRVMKIQIN
jgi:hypothetical protein